MLAMPKSKENNMNQDLQIQIDAFEKLYPLFNFDSYTPGSTKLYRATQNMGEHGGVKSLSDRLPAYSMIEWINGFLCAYEMGE